jgi:prophage regulatory protein
LKQIIGDKTTNIPAIIPVSKSTWWDGVKTGRFPRP